MNNFQISSGKFVSPPKVLVNHSETYGNYPKKTKLETKHEITPRGALNIFYESKNFNRDELQADCTRKTTRKKCFRNFQRRSTADVKKRTKKNEKKIQSQKGTPRKLYQGRAVSEIPKTSVIFSSKTSQKSDWFSLTNSVDLRESNEKSTAKVESERAPLNALFTPIKFPDLEKKYEKLELIVKPKVSAIANQTLSCKNSVRMDNKSGDLKATISDFGKRRINEILKSHAQKISTTVKTVQIKDYSVQPEETAKKSANSVLKIISSGPIEEKKETEQQKHEETQLEKEKIPVAKYKTEVQSEILMELKDNLGNDDSSEEEKKKVRVWMKAPQSNELERRLRTTWQDSILKQISAPEGEKRQPEVPGSVLQDDKKNEKRVTYTDRLLLLKLIGKSLESKKRTESENEKDGRNQSKKSGSKENCVKKVENLTPSPMKEITLSDRKDLILAKENKQVETENVIKTKTTRSMELRDLVSQAIKDHKIFCIFDNHTYIVRPVREELLSRGWLEVIPDRRLIPRRRPPPMGPVCDRDRAVVERNCNTLEAILAAKETFANEIQETVSKSSSFRIVIEKSKIAAPAVSTVAKKSDDSLSESYSLFRIIPPTPEKKRNNFEIREFVAKYQAYIQKEKERENEIQKLKEKEKLAKSAKGKEKPKTNNTQESQKFNFLPQRAKAEEQVEDTPPPLLKGSKSLEDIMNTIINNKKIIIQTATQLTGIDAKVEEPSEGMVCDVKQAPPAIEEKKEAKPKSSGTSTTKSFFSDSDSKAISKIIQSSNARIYFMWLSIKPGIHLKCFNYSPEIVNKFQKTSFCTKIGLWSHLNNMQWYAHEVPHPAKSPRMYNTGEADDLQAFFLDFQMTACIGILKWLSDTFFEKGLKAVQAKKGKVPIKAFEFAIKQCEKYIRFKENEELSLPDEPKLHQEEWNTFLQWFYIITNDHGKVQETSSAQLMVVYTRAVEILKVMRRYWPEIDIDGRLNIWIMKPYCASCGRGIFMTNNVYYIGQHSKYIVQKYIEKPLLIYNTKFDIRQWFMITKLVPLEIWMYKECYLRFCSQPFALRNLHESVHLSNNSVQRKYISFRDPNLPDQNMWDSSMFQLYLKTIGQPNAWNDIIYPGMRDAIVSTMLAAQDTFDGPRKSWFEVYGADFMLSANLKEGPWLIEINENPAMDPSTKVTARLCPQMLRDVIKVVVDKRTNKNANTGQWELVYKQNYSPSYGTVDIDVRGKKIARVPPTTKINLNLAVASFTSNKKIGTDEMGFGKAYEHVRDYEDVLKRAARTGKSQEKWISDTRAFGEDIVKKSDTQLRRNSRPKTSSKRVNERKEVIRNIQTDVYSAGENKEKCNTERKALTDVKNSMISLTGRLNKDQNSFPTSNTTVKTSESRKKETTPCIQFPVKVTNIIQNAKNEFDFQTEKHKFTKYYKI